MDKGCKDIVRTPVSRNPPGVELSSSTTISSRDKEEAWVARLADCTNQKRPGIFNVQNEMGWTTPEDELQRTAHTLEDIVQKLV